MSSKQHTSKLSNGHLFEVYRPVNEFHIPGSLMTLLDDIQSMCVLRGGAIPFRRLIDSISNLEHLMSVIRGTE